MAGLVQDKPLMLEVEGEAQTVSVPGLVAGEFFS